MTEQPQDAPRGTRTPDHERIWLEPDPCCDPDVGRVWCQDNLWDDDDLPATGYVRADMYQKLLDRVERLLIDNHAYRDTAQYEESVLEARAATANARSETEAVCRDNELLRRERDDLLGQRNDLVHDRRGRSMGGTQSNPDHDLLLAGEAARLAGVAPATVRWWTDVGKLPAITTPSGVRLIRRVDLKRLIETRASTCGSRR